VSVMGGEMMRRGESGHAVTWHVRACHIGKGAATDRLQGWVVCPAVTVCALMYSCGSEAVSA
jgi:hypothetical protein